VVEEDQRDAEGATWGFQIVKIMHAIFYIMVVNDVLHIGMVMRNIALVLRDDLMNLS